MKKPTVIACANHKGGSGKTTLAAGLTSSLQEKGYRVLAIDTDPQRNFTNIFELEETTKGKSLVNAVNDMDSPVANDENSNFDGTNYILKTPYENVDLIPSHADMMSLEPMFTVMITDREFYVKRIIENIAKKEDYDFVIVDTSPTLGLTNFNVFVASDYVIIPVECSSFGIEGLEGIVGFFKSAKRINPDLEIAGIVMSRVDRRESITEKAIDITKDIFGDIVFETKIQVDTSIKKSQWNKELISSSYKSSRAAKEYASLTEEVLDIVKKERVEG